MISQLLKRDFFLSLFLRLGLLLLCLLVSSTVMGCTSSNPDARSQFSTPHLATMPEIILSPADQGKTIPTQVGAIVLIRLAENPTTGYRWELTTIDDRYIELQQSDYLPPASANMGSGGTRTFQFKTKAAGTSTLHLILRRSWEAPDKAIEQFSVTLQIQ